MVILDASPAVGMVWIRMGATAMMSLPDLDDLHRTLPATAGVHEQAGNCALYDRPRL